MASITFTFHEIPSFRFEKLLLRSFLPNLFVEEKVPFQKIGYIFCSDAFLLAMNKEYLKHDTYTDILTFSLSEPPQPVISEIYISIERVRYNAGKFGVPFVNELHRVIIHGLLHLCGYTDHTPELKNEMTQKEDYYLEKLGST